MLKIALLAVAVAAVGVGFEHAAHAMGCDHANDLVAWNADGTAALLETESDCQGDRGVSWSVVATSGKATTAATSHTTREPGKDVQDLPVADCAKGARALAAAVVAHHFTGVAVSAEGCKQPGRGVVTTTPQVARDVELSWVALPQGRTATAREQAAWDAVKVVQPDWQPFAPTDNCDATPTTMDVASRVPGKLVLVFSSWRCNSPIKVTVTGFANGKQLDIWAS